MARRAERAADSLWSNEPLDTLERPLSDYLVALTMEDHWGASNGIHQPPFTEQAVRDAIREALVPWLMGVAGT